MMDFKVASDPNARVFFEGFGEFERPLQVTPEIANWRYLSFRIYKFRQGQVLDGESASDEMVMVLLTGKLTLRAAEFEWELDGRNNVFEGKPHVLYLPPHKTYHLTIHADCDVAYSRAPATGKFPVRLARPENIRTERRDGLGGGYRVHHLLSPGETEKLLCTETIAPGNSWLPFPPYKHDADDLPNETYLEAVRYYRFQPATAWGMARLYGDRDLDATLPVYDGDAVIVRRGFQTTAAMPGCQVYCLNFLGGPAPVWAVRSDPNIPR
jgi:5-deoxy-glucuronate isomerase